MKAPVLLCILLALNWAPIAQAQGTDPDQILRKIEKNVRGPTCDPVADTLGRPAATSSKADRRPAVVSVDAEYDLVPVGSEIKLKLECPVSECQLARRAELLQLFKPKVTPKNIWLYDFADKRLKDKVTIRKRTEKGQTLLTVKLKNVAKAEIAAITAKYLSAASGVKGNKCEQDWNEQDRDSSPYSCSLTVALTPEQQSLEKPNPQNILTAEQRELIREFKGIDLVASSEEFAFPPAYFDAEEQKLAANSEVSVETWWKPGADGARACYAFEISVKVAPDHTTIGAGAANTASAKLNEIVKPFLDRAAGCELIKSTNQTQTKSM